VARDRVCGVPVPETLRDGGKTVPGDRRAHSDHAHGTAARLLAAGLCLATVLLWTMPHDADPFLRARLVGQIQGRPDTLILATFDSLRQAAPESTAVNVGCIHSSQVWRFWLIILDYAGNASLRSNTLTDVFIL